MRVVTWMACDRKFTRGSLTGYEDQSSGLPLVIVRSCCCRKLSWFCIIFSGSKVPGSSAPALGLGADSEGRSELGPGLGSAEGSSVDEDAA